MSELPKTQRGKKDKVIRELTEDFRYTGIFMNIPPKTYNAAKQIITAFINHFYKLRFTFSSKQNPHWNKQMMLLISRWKKRKSESGVWVIQSASYCKNGWKFRTDHLLGYGDKIVTYGSDDSVKVAGKKRHDVKISYTTIIGPQEECESFSNMAVVTNNSLAALVNFRAMLCSINQFWILSLTSKLTKTATSLSWLFYAT